MPSTTGYDAFISYSRHEDGWLAPALQSGLEGFAKPWYRVRGLRVFRDKESLAASPELWGSIETALRDSRWLILLASPEAARSAWVDREVAWWLANKPPDRILIVATSGPLQWDKQTGDWAEGTLVPPSLRGAFREEPLWADLTSVRAGRGRVRVPDEDLATMAAPLRGVDRDTLIGEHLRQHRRTMRVVRSVIATLTALLVVAVAASIVAVGQRDQARTEARIATARELAALSGSMVGSNLDIAQLLAVAAYQTDRDPQTEGALVQAAAASPQLVRYLQAGSAITALASSADETTIVAGTTDGDLVAFDLATGRRATVHAMSGAVTQLSVSADGRAVAAMSASQAVTWSPGSPRAAPVGGISAPAYVAVSPSGGQTALLEGYAAPTGPESLVVRAADGAERAISVTPIPGESESGDFNSVGFPSNSSIVLFSSLGQWRRLNPASLRTTAESDTDKGIGSTQLDGVADNGAYAGYELEGKMTIWPTFGTGQPSTFLHGTVPGATSGFFTIRPDGQEVAIAESNTIDVAPLSTSPTASAQYGTPLQLTGSSDTGEITFLGNRGELASAAGSTISVWNPQQTSRLSAPTGIAVPFNSQSQPPPVLLSSPDGKWVSLVGGGETGARLIASGHAGSTAAKKVPGSAVVDGGWDLPIRNGDTPLLVGLDSSGLVLADANGTIVRTFPAPPIDLAPGEPAGDAVPPVPAGASMLPGGKQFVLVGQDGSVLVYDTPAGTVRQVVRGDINTIVFPFNAAVSPNGTSVAIGEWLNSPSGEVISEGIRYVDLRTGHSYMVGTGASDGMLFTTDNLLIQRDSGTVEIWNLTGQKWQRSLPGTGSVTAAMAVSPDGTLLARLRDDGTLSITDLASGDVLGTFSLPPPATSLADPWASTDIAFAADGSLLTATTGGQLVRWTVDPADLVRSICATVGGTLTDAQWQQYAGTNPPAVMPCAP
jgi:WD40 repeat protein